MHLLLVRFDPKPLSSRKVSMKIFKICYGEESRFVMSAVFFFVRYFAVHIPYILTSQLCWENTRDTKPWAQSSSCVASE